jgi:DNA-directed RNA polymerase beta subunit
MASDAAGPAAAAEEAMNDAADKWWVEVRKQMRTTMMRQECLIAPIHIDPMDHAMDRQLLTILKDAKLPSYKDYKFKIVDARYQWPLDEWVSPHTCRQTSTSYHVKIMILLEETYREIKKPVRELEFCKFPLMVFSKWCIYPNLMPPDRLYEDSCSAGGYFVNSGKAHFIQPSETTIHNYPMVRAEAFLKKKKPTGPTGTADKGGRGASGGGPAARGGRPFNRFQSSSSSGTSTSAGSADDAKAMPLVDFKLMKRFSSLHQQHGSDTMEWIKRHIDTRASGSAITVDGKTLQKKWLVSEIRSLNEIDRHRSTNTSFIVHSYVQKSSVVGGYECLVQMAYHHQPIPITVLMVALGVEMVEYVRMMQWFAGEHWSKTIETILIAHLAQHPSYVTSAKHAYEWIAGKCQDTVLRSERDIKYRANAVRTIEHRLRHEFLAHIGKLDSFHPQKAVYVGGVVWKLMAQLLKLTVPEHRDDLALKKLEQSGVLTASLFRQLVSEVYVPRLDRAIRTHVEQKSSPFPYQSVFSGERVGQKYRRALDTGNWSANERNAKQRKGAALSLVTVNARGMDSMLRRCASNIQIQNKKAEPRQFTESQIGYFCPYTPEGEQCGLVHTFALSTTISKSYSSEPLIQLIRAMSSTLPVTLLSDAKPWAESRLSPLLHKFLKQPAIERDKIEQDENAQPPFVDKRTCTPRSVLYVNGIPVATTTDPQALRNILVQWRRDGLMERDIGISYQSTLCNVWVSSEPGRFLRPLVAMDRWKSYMKQLGDNPQGPQVSDFDCKVLMERGVVEYIDPMEMKSVFLCQNIKQWRAEPSRAFTHMEIHELFTYGTNLAEIPFGVFNQQPRNIFQGAMGNQAIPEAKPIYKCTSGTHHEMWYGQLPLVKSCIRSDLGSAQGFGMNVTVALIPHPKTQEDGIVVNRALLDRGAFVTQTYRTTSTTCNRTASGSSREVYGRPDKSCLGRKNESYDHLDDQGMPAIRQVIRHSQALIGKMTSIKKVSEHGSVNMSEGYKDEQSQYRKRDESLFSKRGTAQVVACKKVVTDQLAEYASVTTVQVSYAQKGDKLSSRHGQKGTIADVMNPEDMPFGPDGVAPDMMVNPLCMPSRMTLGHLSENVSGHLAAKAGTTVNATSFDVTMGNLKARLSFRPDSFEKAGLQMFTDGKTGKRILTPCCRGTLYYQQLTHKVEEKMHARSFGPCELLTRQPNDGRGRDGGIRFGEMEEWCVQAAGAAFMSLSTTCKSSDSFEIPVCAKCHVIAVANDTYSYKWCNMCGSGDHIHTLPIGYSAKLFWQEQLSMMILPELILETEPLRDQLESWVKQNPLSKSDIQAWETRVQADLDQLKQLQTKIRDAKQSTEANQIFQHPQWSKRKQSTLSNTVPSSFASPSHDEAVPAKRGTKRRRSAAAETDGIDDDPSPRSTKRANRPAASSSLSSKAKPKARLASDSDPALLVPGKRGVKRRADALPDDAPQPPATKRPKRSNPPPSPHDADSALPADNPKSATTT